MSWLQPSVVLVVVMLRAVTPAVVVVVLAVVAPTVVVLWALNNI